METEIKKKLKLLNVIYLVIMGTMSIAALASVYLVYKIGALSVFDDQTINMLKSLVIIALLAGIPVSHIFYHKKIKHIDAELPLLKKLNMFQIAFVVRIAMLEGIGLLTAICYLIAADNSFLYMFGVVFILFIIHAPTRQRISTDLNLIEDDDDLLH